MNCDWVGRPAERVVVRLPVRVFDSNIILPGVFRQECSFFRVPERSGYGDVKISWITDFNMILDYYQETFSTVINGDKRCMFFLYFGTFYLIVRVPVYQGFTDLTLIWF